MHVSLFQVAEAESQKKEDLSKGTSRNDDGDKSGAVIMDEDVVDMLEENDILTGADPTTTAGNRKRKRDESQEEEIL